MTPSEEVLAAFGAAPEHEKKIQKDIPSVLDQLKLKQESLAKARERYKIARQMRDEDALATEGRIIDALLTIIPELETEMVGEREVSAKQAAAKRLVGIHRAYGSVASSINADEARVGEKIAELSDAITRLNDRYSQVVQLRAEAMALSDRFDLAKPTLPDVVPPARRDLAITLTRLPNKLRERVDRYQPTEQCEHRMRTRRTYAEASGTEGYKIIESAGLKPFPELTTRQQQMIAARERELEEERRQMAGLPKIPSEGSIPLGSL